MEPLDHDADTSMLNASRRASTCSDLGVGNDEEDHIRVICRSVGRSREEGGSPSSKHHVGARGSRLHTY